MTIDELVDIYGNRGITLIMQEAARRLEKISPAQNTEFIEMLRDLGEELNEALVEYQRAKLWGTK